MVVVGIGVIPDVELAETGGLDCGNGVRVDEYCKTSDPAVYAAGDCACHPNIFAGGESVRLESIQNATDQARTIAAGIAGVARPYAAVPWFWSDQGAHSLQMTGLSLSATAHVTRGDPATGSFSVFHFKKSQLLAVDSVNMPRDHMLARKLLGAGVSPTADQAADPDYDLKSLL